MFLRISILLVLLRCGGPVDDMPPREATELNATYMKFVPGAGGGKGITFKVHSTDSVANLSVQKFVVNNIEVPAEVFYDQGTLIEGTLFYEDPEMTVDNLNPEPVDAVLYNQDEFTGVIYYTMGAVSDSLIIDEFRKIESPLYK